MAKWIGNNKAYKRVIKKQLPKVEENINKEEKSTDEAIKKLMKKAKEKANGSV